MIEIETLIDNLEAQIEIEAKAVDLAFNAEDMRYHSGRHDALEEVLDSVRAC